MSLVITVENLGKKYLLSHQSQRQPYVALRDVIAEKTSAIGSRLLHPFDFSPVIRHPSHEEFWALKDVSFDIKQGEKIGIIGRNGAGKSTLLKILSRITEPTTGRVGIKGRVASLLEVGTGFHPELTGRENIFLNGAILGMTKVEIKRKFDEIVDFAEMEKFLDTPVKRYSSGMYVRLAFAVSAHLEAEILLLDEVLAVGDNQFQEKCLGKMENLNKQGGKTVLFVSHNLPAIRQFCSRALLLNAGEISIDTDAPAAIDYYLEHSKQKQNYESDVDNIIMNLPPDSAFKLRKICLNQNNRGVKHIVENGKPLEIVIHYDVLEKTTGLRVFIELYDNQENLLFRSFHDEDNDAVPIIRPGAYISKVIIPDNWLAPTTYYLRIQSGIFNERRCLPESALCIPLTVEHTGGYNRAYLGDTIRGKFAFLLDWSTEKAQ